jgi:hypothetical protein
MSRDTLSPDEVKILSAEHSALSQQQYEALLKSSYLLMSPAEAADYDQRRLRIGEICGILAKVRTRDRAA